MIAYKITITGRVQGVSFRLSTKAVADQLGVKGFVKNQTDGSVYIEAEAEDIYMQEFLNWCKQGPDEALVQNIAIEAIEIKMHQNFNILKKAIH
ncbi:MAG: acylphosphatase [Sphingobacteriales bacterium]|jgi:acylphosphatase|nr:MAG: acylphosphatase [Sphingobacteriales bacterium]TAF44380.1 MAG: acylphosphatase [Sphingobacteriales bacterium]TAF78467.1 MAG: acylphosphatase [Sphingobacteriales bacterium]